MEIRMRAWGQRCGSAPTPFLLDFPKGDRGGRLKMK
jgi:hypothetical protein